MTPYQFQSEDFALSDTGIHLLRNKFNFKTISYDEVTKASILRGSEIKRPLIILLLGIAMIVFAIKQSLYVYWLFTNPRAYTIYIESIVIPVIPAALGIYCLFSALKKAPVFKLEDGKMSHKLRLRSFLKNNQYPELRSYLNTKLGPRLYVANDVN